MNVIPEQIIFVSRGITVFKTLTSVVYKLWYTDTYYFCLPITYIYKFHGSVSVSYKDRRTSYKFTNIWIYSV